MSIKEELAIIISLLFSAPVYAFFLLLLILTETAYSSSTLLIVGILGFLFLSVLPIAPVIYAAYKKETDLFVEEREQRPKFFFFAIISYLAGFIIFLSIGERILALFHLCYAVVTASLALATFFAKVSVHAAGVAGPTTFMVLVFGYEHLLLFLLLIPVAWARIYLKAHSINQSILGAIIAIGVTWLTITVFDPIIL
ncbi:MAG: hypothetical protein ACTSX9_03425 [Candidatus Njordarchaeales archaeon]